MLFAVSPNIAISCLRYNDILAQRGDGAAARRDTLCELSAKAPEADRCR